MTSPEKDSGHNGRADLHERAAADFLRRRSQDWSEDDERNHQQSLQDPELGAAHQTVERLWEGIEHSANRPEFLGLREQALARARRAHRRRWGVPRTSAQRFWGIAAGGICLAIAAGVLWQLSPYGFRLGVYQTNVGEQRTIELSDQSHIALDSDTQLRARLTADARTIEIIHGQAQFSVARDPARPFKVIAGNHIIVALGTVFTVEYADRTVHVAMMEGRVAVLTPDDSNVPPPGSAVTSARADLTASSAGPEFIQLSAGDELRFARDGKPTVTPHADLAAATAWREGKVIFHAEPLGDAVRRLNRYSHVQLQVEGVELSQLSVSGVFDAGDSRAFAEAVQAYLPVVADYSQRDVIQLRTK